MNRGFNFGAGPAMLPDEVLAAAQQELLNWQGLGMSVLEIGHRTREFMDLLEQTEQLLRQLLNIPANYQVLFLGGAARTHFALVPLNFLEPHEQAGYYISGFWSAMAYEEAVKLKKAYRVADKQRFNPNSKYIYYTPNETIEGVRIAEPPNYKNIPIIADMTSCLLSETINISDYGLIIAGAQKNIANAGLTIIIVADELLNSIKQTALPTMFDYRTHVKHKSLYATPPVFNCYLAWKMLQWVKQQGGVEAFHQLNIDKSTKLYDFIDNSTAYHCKIDKVQRSRVNVCFSLGKPELDTQFIKEAAEQGLLNLKGHRITGGIRASLYNAMPMKGVDKLIEFMAKFAEVQQL